MPIGPGWSSARAHSQAASTSTESGGHGELAITVLRTSGLEQQTSGMRKVTSKVTCPFLDIRSYSSPIINCCEVPGWCSLLQYQYNDPKVRRAVE